MLARRWRILVVPDGAGKTRSFELSRLALRTALVSAGIFAAAALLVSYTTVTKTLDLSELQRLETTNQLLAQELDRAQGIINDLTDTVSTIAARDEEIRLLAGLAPVEPAVLQAGIGGPAMAPTEAERVLASDVLGQDALEMRFDLTGLLKRASLLAGSFEEASESLSTHVDRMRRTPSLKPTQGWITSPFAARRIHPLYGVEMPHEGIDIYAPVGTPIKAAAAGVVIDAGMTRGYGNLVTIDHGYGIVTRYAHTSKILVRRGQHVKRNDIIALVGHTGQATGPHLHYEVIVRGRHVDPRNFIFPDPRIVD